MIRCTCGLLFMVVAAIAAVASPEASYVETQQAKFYDPAKLRAECDRLLHLGPHCFGGYQHLGAFMDKLARAGDEDALRFIIISERPGPDLAASFAATRYAKLLGPRDGVKFARTLKPGSQGWRAIVWTLSFSNGREIREYIKETMRLHRGPRAFCYDLDMCRGWGDLVDAAWTDLDSTDRIYEDAWLDAELGYLAREYLERFEKNRAIPPRKNESIPPQ